MEDTPPEVIVLRSVLATTAHDLGGLASALLLRADVLEHGPSDTTVRALRSIAGELRVLGQQLRALRDNDGTLTLAPPQPSATTQWSARATRFGIGLLPRGSTIECTVNDAIIPPSLAHPLWLISLALLGAIAEIGPEARLTVRINSEHRDGRFLITFAATSKGLALDVTDATRSTWWNWASDHARQQQLTLSAESLRVVIAMPPALDT